MSRPISDAEGRPSQLRQKFALRANDLVQPLDDMKRHADCPPLVRNAARNRLAYPPGCVRRELEAPPVIEFLSRARESDRAFLDQVHERQAAVAVPLGDRYDEAKIRLDHRLLRPRVAPLNALGQLDLLGCGEERHFPDGVQEALQRVGCVGLFGLEPLARRGLKRRVDLRAIRSSLSLFDASERHASSWLSVEAENTVAARANHVPSNQFSYGGRRRIHARHRGNEPASPV